MEPLTINQELYNLSLADLYCIQQNIREDEDYELDKNGELYELVNTEIYKRIDLIKSKM
jgi:hypothetical protein